MHRFRCSATLGFNSWRTDDSLRWRYVSVVLLLLAFTSTGSTQYAEFVRAGRPGQAMGTYAVGNQVLQFEQGVTLQRQTLDAFTGEGDQLDVTSLTNNNVIRYGLAERWEVSSVVVVQRAEVVEPQVDAKSETGISLRQVRGRYGWTKESDKVPSIAVQLGWLIPWDSEVFTRKNSGFTLQTSIGKSVTEWLSLTANVGMTNAGNEDGTKGFYVGAASFSVSDKLSVLVEGYGRFEPFDVNVDAGLAYTVNPRLQLDALYGRQGFGQFEGDLPALDDDWFLSVGASYRFVWRDKN